MFSMPYVGNNQTHQLSSRSSLIFKETFIIFILGTRDVKWTFTNWPALVIAGVCIFIILVRIAELFYQFHINSVYHNKTYSVKI